MHLDGWHLALLFILVGAGLVLAVLVGGEIYYAVNPDKRPRRCKRCKIDSNTFRGVVSNTSSRRIAFLVPGFHQSWPPRCSIPWAASFGFSVARPRPTANVRSNLYGAFHSAFHDAHLHRRYHHPRSWCITADCTFAPLNSAVFRSHRSRQTNGTVDRYYGAQ